jgi:hypothetical protein
VNLLVDPNELLALNMGLSLRRVVAVNPWLVRLKGLVALK